MQDWRACQTLRGRADRTAPSGRSQDGAPSDEFYMLTDNGFGNKVNSPDAMLMFHKIRANFTSKKASVSS
jgi:hypothetical protein